MIFKDILQRIQQQYDHKNDSATARFLGVSPQTLNGWKNTNSPDYNLIFEKCTNIDLHWLLTGQRAPSAVRHTPEEMLKRAEIKENVADLLTKKAIALVETGSNKELQDEIEVLRQALKAL